MLLSVLLFWLGHLVLLEPFQAQMTDKPRGETNSIAKYKPERTHSEVQFIQIEFGIVYKPRSLSKREKLALALTNVVSNDQ
jgi:hypothetical protein